MNQTNFVSELKSNLKNNNVELSKEDLNIIVTEFVSLIHNVVLYRNEEVKFNKFAVFYLGKTAPRKLPNGEIVVPRDIMRVRLSENFKDKQS